MKSITYTLLTNLVILIGGIIIGYLITMEACKTQVRIVEKTINHTDTLYRQSEPLVRWLEKKYSGTPVYPKKVIITKYNYIDSFNIKTKEIERFVDIPIDNDTLKSYNRVINKLKILNESCDADLQKSIDDNKVLENLTTTLANDNQEKQIEIESQKQTIKKLQPKTKLYVGAGLMYDDYKKGIASTFYQGALGVQFKNNLMLEYNVFGGLDFTHKWPQRYSIKVSIPILKINK